MPAPYNYSVDPANPIADFAKTYALGSAIQEQNAARQAQEQARLQQQEYANDVRTYFVNPTASGAAMLTAKYPQMKDAFKHSWEMQSQAQKDEGFTLGIQAFNALRNGKPEIAKQIVDNQIAAYRNSGKDFSQFETMRQALDAAPQIIQANLGIALSSIDPEKWSKIAGEQRTAEKAPVELSKLKAEAAIKESEAPYAGETARWSLEKIKADIASDKEKNRIAAMNAAISRETNVLKRQELGLKVQELQSKLDTDARQRVSELDSGRATIDNFLNTADRLLQNPSLNRVVGAIEGRLPGGSAPLSDESADAIRMLETLGSQAFLSQIPSMKGTGALSNAEGDKLQASLTNLSRVQSEKQLTENIKEAQRLMLKARGNLTQKYGAKETVPDTPAAKPKAGKSVDDMLRELGVMK